VLSNEVVRCRCSITQLSVAAEKTLAEVQRRLIAFGARRFAVEFDKERQPTAVEFEVDTEFGPRRFLLEANLKGVEAALVRQYHAGQVARKVATSEQAVRVAWRITKDWLEAQLALVEAGIVPLDQAMLPYLVGPGGRTVYQVFRDQKLSLPGPDVE
jgi:hypothetical protein